MPPEKSSRSSPRSPFKQPNRFRLRAQADGCWTNIHGIADDYARRSHPKIKPWLASWSRLHIYSISAYSSSLNQGERLLDKITDKSLRRNAFVGDRQFVRRFDRFVAHRTACKFPTPR